MALGGGLPFLGGVSLDDSTVSSSLETQPTWGGGEKSLEASPVVGPKKPDASLASKLADQRAAASEGILAGFTRSIFARDGRVLLVSRGWQTGWDLLWVPPGSFVRVAWPRRRLTFDAPEAEFSAAAAEYTPRSGSFCEGSPSGSGGGFGPREALREYFLPESAETRSLAVVDCGCDPARVVAVANGFGGVSGVDDSRGSRRGNGRTVVSDLWRERDVFPACFEG